MTSEGMKVRVPTVSTALVLTLLAACVTPAYQTASVAPAPCADSSYVALSQQVTDSLSEREWQRLQSLERQCAAARLSGSTVKRRDAAGRHGGWMGIDHAAGIGIMTIVMTAMMVTMW